MKTAIDCYERGKQKEANADEYSRQRSYSVGRFICPECGEFVYLTGSKYSNHFAHYKKTDLSVECDKRIDGVPTQSLYERLGLPIYLRRLNSDDFGLFMGFYSVPLKILEQAERDHLLFHIIGANQSYRVNRERFDCNGTTLIPIMYIPSGQSNYHIKYEPVECAKDILNYWSNEADGFSYEGALFSSSGLGGKKVRHGDNISTEKEYYWVRRQSQLPSFIPGINMNIIGHMKLIDTKYYVFLGTFTSSIDDASFSCLATFLRNELKVNLLEKQPAFIPVWPPCIRTEDGYIVSPTTKHIFGHIESGNEKPKMYVYHGIRAVPDEKFIENEIAKVSIFSTETYINIDRKYDSSGIGIRTQQYKLNGKEVFLECLGNRVDTGITNINIGSDIETISISLPYEFDYIIISKNEELIYKKSNSKIMLDSIKSIKTLFIVNNGVLFFILKFNIEEIETENSSHDFAELYNLIRKSKKIKKVYIPHKYRIFLKEKWHNSKQVEQLLNQEEIPVTVLKYFGELYNG